MKNKLIYSLPLVALLAACGGSDNDEITRGPLSVQASEFFAIANDPALDDTALARADLPTSGTANYSGYAIGGIYDPNVEFEGHDQTLVGESSIEIDFAQTSPIVTGTISNIRAEIETEQSTEEQLVYEVDYFVDGNIMIDGSMDASGDIIAEFTTPNGLREEGAPDSVATQVSGEVIGSIATDGNENYLTLDTDQAAIITSGDEALNGMALDLFIAAKEK